MSENVEPEQSNRRSDGEQTHSVILEEAIRLASIEGLSSLTIGRVAEKAGLSKSGLYAHFGSKERLQLEVIEAARRIYVREVIEPAISFPEGIAQLRGLCDAYLSYVERGVFPGGCFFYALIAEFDAQPGRFHEEVSSDRREWDGLFRHNIVVAQERGELDRSVDPQQLSFEVEAVLELTNVRYTLDRDPSIVELGRSIVAATIERSKPQS